jgi:hypothetical protein
VDPSLQKKLSEFVQAFLRDSAKYFSKQMSEPVFMQRLTHIWTTDLVDSIPEQEIQRATWIPAQIHFYPHSYEIHWSLRGIDYVPEPTIPPGFLERGGDLASDIVLDDGNELPGHAFIGGEEGVGSLDAEAIPLSSRFTRAERTERAAQRKRIRQARLRMALAQLKAERLAERYYRRYGDFEDLDDSDSELSEEEDGAKLLREALADEGDSE